MNDLDLQAGRAVLHPDANVAVKAICANHPGVLAAATCARCGCYVCDDCFRQRDGVRLCEACSERLTLNRTNVPARLAVFCGVAGILIPFAGLGSIAFGIAGYRRSRAFHQKRSRWIAMGSVALGTLTSIMWVGLVPAFIAVANEDSGSKAQILARGIIEVLKCLPNILFGG